MKNISRLKNGTVVVKDLKTGDVISMRNIKRGDKSASLSFTKLNGTSFKVLLKEKDNIIGESRVSTTGKVSNLFYDRVISLYMNGKDLYIISSDEIEFYSL